MDSDERMRFDLFVCHHRLFNLLLLLFSSFNMFSCGQVPAYVVKKCGEEIIQKKHSEGYIVIWVCAFSFGPFLLFPPNMSDSSE